jgi:hypothetical protein
MFWAKKNPHFTVKLEHNPQHVMFWADMTATRLICPYFFDAPDSDLPYAEMLRGMVNTTVWRKRTHGRCVAAVR